MDISDYISEREVEQILEDVIRIFLIPHFMSLGMDATGEWRDNIQAKGYSIWGRDYTQFLVKGRKGGSFPPIAPLQRWVTAKLGYQGKEALSVAFAVAHKINEKGTTWYQKGGSDLIEILESNKVITFINKSVSQKIYLKTKVQFENIVKRAI